MLCDGRFHGSVKSREGDICVLAWDLRFGRQIVGDIRVTGTWQLPCKTEPSPDQGLCKVLDCHKVGSDN